MRSTFYPSFVEVSNTHDQLEEKYHNALKDIGFQFDKEEEGDSIVNTSWNLSRGYEVHLTFQMDESNYICVDARERPLNWIHGSVLGSSNIPDIRYLLRTTKSISNSMKDAILPPGKDIPIKLEPDGTVTFTPNDENQKEKLCYIRKMSKRKRFKKYHYLNAFNDVCLDASIILAEEYNKLENGELHGPTKVCELRVEFDTELLLCADSNYHQWADMVIKISTSLAKALSRHGIVR
mmetsp:Transcript_23945/g.27729  ORF Transcript_23945/g.27729 Transcript_23945/m.27729 type:complete len:236 (+) Transcript_23945:2784-3491(+)